MNKQIKSPKSKAQAEQLVDTDQRKFGKLNQDDPASQIGQFDLTNLVNMNSFPTYSEGRTGSKLFASTKIPSLENRTGYTCWKVGDVIYRKSGPDFVVDDTFGHYFFWEDGTREEIIERLSVSSVRVRQTGDKALMGGFVCGTGYGAKFYSKAKRVMYHYDSRLFESNWMITDYAEVPSISLEDLGESESKFFEVEDNIFFINENGIFKVPMDHDVRYAYKINSPGPTERITGVTKTDILTVGRRYLYSMSRLVGDNYHGDRAGSSVVTDVPVLAIEQESGTVLFDIETGRDWGEVFTEDMRGLGDETQGVLLCGAGGTGAVAINPNVGLWAAIQDGTATFNFNGLGAQTFWFDFRGCTTIEEVRQIIEKSLQALCPDATVSIETTAGGLAYWRITTGFVDGSTMSVAGVSAGVGTDISNTNGVAGLGLMGTAVAGAVLSNTATYTDPSIQGSLICAEKRDATAFTPQTHWTHFSVYGDENTNDPTNNPEVYSWLFDIPVMAGYTLTSAAGGLLTCTNTFGLFRQYDIGAVVTFENGVTSTIEYLTDAAGTRVYTPTSRWAHGTHVAVATQSATIGAAEVMTLSKTGRRVTRISGTRNFTATDEKKPLFWADGTITYIIDFIDANTVDTLESGDKASQGAAIDPDPAGRNFGDYITDETIGDMFLKFGLRTRFLEPLPEVNRGCIVPGFMVVGNKNESTIYYSPMAMGDFETRTYNTGYHNPSKQFDNKIEDKIQDIRKYPDSVVVLCANSRWVTSTTNPISSLNSTYGINDALLPNFVLNDNIGVNQTGSIAEVDVGQEIMITSEAAVRFANNTKFGTENLADAQVAGTIAKISMLVRAHYNPYSGYIIWGALAEGPVEEAVRTAVINLNGYGEGGYYGQYPYKGDFEGEGFVQNYINRYTGICLRYAVMPTQGQGWSIYENGENWLWPEPRMPILTVYDASEQPRFIVLDETTGLWWEIGTRQGPAGSGITAIYQDKYNPPYQGAEIPCKIKFKEQTGPREHVKVQHMLSHIGMRPMNEDLRDTEGHTAKGYRNGFEVNYGLYKDGDLTPLTKTNDVPLPGDITVDRKVEGHRLQGEIDTTTSEFRLVGYNPEYLTKDKKLSRSQGDMQEDGYEAEMDSPIFWLTRGINPILDLASESEVAGSYFSLVNGPDVLFESGLTLAVGDSLTHSIPDLSGDFTIMMFVQGKPRFRFIKIGSLEIDIDKHNVLQYFDGPNLITKQLSKFDAWTSIMVQRSGKEIIIGQDGNILDTLGLMDKITYQGNLEINPNDTVDIFDCRVYDKAISSGAYFYYYSEVITNQGKVFLPLWV
jgi:hypothetical protein